MLEADWLIPSDSTTLSLYFLRQQDVPDHKSRKCDPRRAPPTTTSTAGYKSACGFHGLRAIEQPLLAGGSGSQLVQPDAPSWADMRVISHITTPIGSSSLIYLIGISLLQPVTVAFCVWVAGLWAEPTCIFCKRPIHPAGNSAEIPSWSTSLPLLAHHVEQPFTALMVTLNMNHKKQTTTTKKSKQINNKKTTPATHSQATGTFISQPFREEALHHKSYYRKVSKEVRLTFSAHSEYSLLPTHRYELFTSRCHWACLNVWQITVKNAKCHICTFLVRKVNMLKAPSVASPYLHLKYLFNNMRDTA